MGSGHFLVEAVDYITDQVANGIATRMALLYLMLGGEHTASAAGSDGAAGA